MSLGAKSVATTVTDVTIVSAQPEEVAAKPWHVYLIRTRTNMLYCGMTNDLERRFAQHQAGNGAKFLRGKGPLSLVWTQQVANKSQALKLEIKVKKLAKASKEKMVRNGGSMPLAG